jgi:hypothetical protein
MAHNVQLDVFRGLTAPSNESHSEKEFDPYAAHLNPHTIEQGMRQPTEEYPEGGLQGWLTVAGA